MNDKRTALCTKQIDMKSFDFDFFVQNAVLFVYLRPFFYGEKEEWMLYTKQKNDKIITILTGQRYQIKN